AFIAIKVDREERPDIDAIYMQAAMMLNGGGGWPLNVMIMPDGKPFFAATYIPKEDRFGRAGLKTLISKIDQIWRTEPDRILATASQISAALTTSKPGDTQLTLNVDTLTTAYQQFSHRFDTEYGGFGPAPKFPTPHNLLFLLRYWLRTKESRALEMVESTLQAMQQGGIYDHIGFGFHRYATDAKWLLPHFEKMLYDQAMLAMVYSEAFQITRNPHYEQTTREIFSYLFREMTDSEGGFYTAEDADSEGEEGKYYLWSEDEIRALLTEDDAAFVIQTFNFAPAGNFIDEASKVRTGTNIPHLTKPLGSASPRWEIIRSNLLDTRNTRVHPYKDDKILTDWNGLMIAALAKSAQIFNDPQYTNAAAKAANFILQTLRNDQGRLLHRYRDNEAGIQATLDDYAFLIWGLIELYETTFDASYLDIAIQLQDQQITHFWDAENGGFYLTPDDGEKLITRPKEIYDGAIPSGNSIAMQNLLRLGRITANIQYENYAEAIGQTFSNTVLDMPSGYTQLLSALNFAIGPAFEIVVVGNPNASDTQAMLAAIREIYLPNKVLILRPPENDNPITQLAEFTRQYQAVNGKATVYICENYFCHQPTTDIQTMLSMLRKTGN
ncbi:MAG: thioredoxin domain-containing protein, partial [Chloroflexota bacterium]